MEKVEKMEREREKEMENVKKGMEGMEEVEKEMEPTEKMEKGMEQTEKRENVTDNTEKEMDDRVKEMEEGTMQHDRVESTKNKKKNKKKAFTVHMHGEWLRTLALAFQSLGVVFGDIGTSPLYVYPNSFKSGIHHTDDILGVLSIIIYTIVLIPIIKYVCIVLKANDNGDGGTFALYSLICRHVNVSLMPSQKPTEDIPTSTRSSKIKLKLESSLPSKITLFLLTILGTCMLIGDGILTPSISVLSAIGGISSSLSQDVIVWISVAILIVLFSIQRFGTNMVGYAFAPIMCLWFFVIASIGIYNIYTHDVGVLRAFNPAYIIYYFNTNGKQAWINLGGIILCTTGTECMFADLGHFNIRAVQISFSGVVLPAILSTYIGQAAYLMKHPDQYANSFYASIPDGIYWPTFVLAISAAIIASQSLITGAFSVIAQSQSLGCFPRVKVVHTSPHHEGQLYIPEINYLLMICCILVTLVFRSTENIGNAYGIAVVIVMFITTCMVTLVMLAIWDVSVWCVALFSVVFISVEGLYLSSVLYKFTNGGFLPLIFSLVLMCVMGVWYFTTKELHLFKLRNKVPSSYIQDIAANPKILRIPGLGLIYSEIGEGIPPIFPHLVETLSSVHSVLIFISVQTLPFNKASVEERFVFRQVEPRCFRAYQCIVRYGFNDMIKKPNEFEQLLMEHLEGFIRHENRIVTEPRRSNIERGQTSSSSINEIEEEEGESLGAEEEIFYLENAKKEGVFYLLGETEVKAKQDSSRLKKAMINAYCFMRKNSRHGEKVLEFPHERLLRVGMVYEL